jgi:hypothetical protein
VIPPRRRRLPAWLCALLLGAGPAHAEDVLPPSFQAVLLLKALAYDQALKTRTPSGTVRILVLFRGDAPASRDTADAVLEALRQAAPAGVGGLTLEARALAFTSLPALEAALLAPKATALWVAPELADQLPGLEVISRRHAVLTAGSGEAAARAGLTLGLASKGGKPQLFVNLGSARAEGVRLDSGLLRLAQVIP